MLLTRILVCLVSTYSTANAGVIIVNGSVSLGMDIITITLPAVTSTEACGGTKLPEETSTEAYSSTTEETATEEYSSTTEETATEEYETTTEEEVCNGKGKHKGKEAEHTSNAYSSDEDDISSKKKAILEILKYLSKTLNNVSRAVNSYIKNLKKNPRARRSRKESLAWKLKELLEKAHLDLCKDFGFCQRGFLSEFLDDTLRSMRQGTAKNCYKVLKPFLREFVKTKFFTSLRRYTKLGFMEFLKRYDDAENITDIQAIEDIIINDADGMQGMTKMPYKPIRIKEDIVEMRNQIRDSTNNETIDPESAYFNETVLFRRLLNGADTLFNESDVIMFDELIEDIRFVLVGRQQPLTYVKNLINYFEEHFNSFPEIIIGPIHNDAVQLFDWFFDESHQKNETENPDYEYDKSARETTTEFYTAML